MMTWVDLMSGLGGTWVDLMSDLGGTWVDLMSDLGGTWVELKQSRFVVKRNSLGQIIFSKGLMSTKQTIDTPPPYGHLILHQLTLVILCY